MGVLVRPGDGTAENVGRAKSGGLSTTLNPVGKSKVVVVAEFPYFDSCKIPFRFDGFQDLTIF